jgi:F-type H+-transporting ATPase subunit beta
VIALHYLGGYSQAEIARVLDLPPTTVKKRAHDARLHLREELSMVRTTLTCERTTGIAGFSDGVELFLAIRHGDAGAVRALVERRPELLEQHEDWPREDAHRARLPYAREGSALIRAAERGDLTIVRLLLDAGANVDGACGCAAGETPLWAAVASDYPDVAALLLERGANPNTSGPLGHSALHVAAMRGWSHLVRLLLEHGADPLRVDDAGRTALDWARLKNHADVVALLTRSAGRPTVEATTTTRPRRDGGSAGGLCETGIKAIDLFAPVQHGDLVFVDGDYGLGLVVLLGELMLALRERGYSDVLWTGFEQTLITERELDHALGELGRRDAAELALVPAGLDGDEAREVFQRRLDQWAGCSVGGRRLLIVFEAEGQVAEVEAALPRLTRGGAQGVTAVVVAPETFPAKGAGSRQALPPGAACHLRFDAARARRGYYPAVDVRASVSANLTSEMVGAEHAAVAEDARRLLEAYRRSDPELALPAPESLPARQRTTAVRAQRLHAFLTQPFVFAEPFTGTPGLRVPRIAAVRGARVILDGATDALPAERLRYIGGVDDVDARMAGTPPALPDATSGSHRSARR